jgi:hypothetical protein
MPNLPNRFSAYPLSVTLDGNGDGTLRFQATGQNIQITNLYVAVATRTLQATCTMYKGQIGPAYAIKSTNSGSTGASATGSINLLDGEAVYVVWEGGDVGAVATATFSGVVLPFNVRPESVESFLWDDPIAASDGSLVYPGLQSINFVTGVTGWRIARNGDVEFNNGTFRGTLVIRNPTTGRGVTINSSNGFISLHPNEQIGHTVTAGRIVPGSNSGNGSLSIVSPTLDGLPTSSILLSSDDLDGVTFSNIFFNADSVTVFNDMSLNGTLSNNSDNAIYLRGEQNSVSFNLAAVTSASLPVTFTFPFNTVPNVSLNIRSGSGQIRGWGARALNVTTSGFDVFIFSPLVASPTATLNPCPVDWTATVTA